jgi:hypothetical protein
MIKNWNQFNESISEVVDTNIIELVEDLFIGVAEKWNLENSESLANSWYVSKDHIIYSSPPKNPKIKLFIRIRKAKSIKFEIDLEKFFSRIKKFGYRASRYFEMIQSNHQRYYHININKVDINESSKFKHPSDIRVTEEQFLEKESKSNREEFTPKEIESVRQITEVEKSYLGKCMYKLSPETVGNTISFETTCGHYYVIIIKLEDEWYLIEERPKRGNAALSKGFFMADGFEQIEDFLKWYV